LLALAGVIGLAAILLIAGTLFQQARARSAAELPIVSAEAPPDTTAVPLAAAGVVTAPVHMAAPENENPPLPSQGIVIGASTPAASVQPTPLASPPVPAAPVQGGRKAAPVPRPPVVPLPAPVLRKAAPAPAAGKPGLPRERQ
jgi:translation initiation factor IF-2